MKSRYKRAALIPIMGLLLIYTASCRKSTPETVNTPKKTVYQFVSGAKELSLFRAALTRAGLFNPDTLGSGPYTLFAPVDSAFISAGLTTDKINSYDRKTLKLLVKYMIVNGELGSANLAGFYGEDATSLNPYYKPRVTKNYYGIAFNGITLVKNGSNTLADGVVQEMTKVAFPPAGSLQQIIDNNPDLSIFAAAVKLALVGDGADLADTTGAYTLFAPTNEAFQRIGYPDPASLQNIYFPDLQTLTQYSFFNGRLFTSDFIGNGYSLSGSNVAYIKSDGLTIISLGNVSPTHIIHPDIVANNGVLHIVDQVFVP